MDLPDSILSTVILAERYSGYYIKNHCLLLNGFDRTVSGGLTLVKQFTELNINNYCCTAAADQFRSDCIESVAL